MTPPELSILIVNYNGRELLGRCLEAARAAAEPMSLEVLVVDNASTDGSREWLQARADVRLIESPSNEGFARGMNRALAAANGGWFVWLNPDCRLEPGSLPEAVQALRLRGGAAVLGPRLVGEDGRPQPSALAWSSPTRAALHALGARNLMRLPGAAMLAGVMSRALGRGAVADYLTTQAAPSAPREVDWLSGACLLLSRETARLVGDLDEEFFMYSEDEAWCRRAAAAGVPRIWFPAWNAIHVARASGRGSPFIQCHYYRSLWIYQRKYCPGGNATVAAAILWVCTWGQVREWLRGLRGAADAPLRRRLWRNLAAWILRGNPEPCGPTPPPAWPPASMTDAHAR